MTNDDDPRAGKAATATASGGGTTDRDSAAKAVLDNMARLRALRLAREAAAPQSAAPGKSPAKTSRGKTAGGTKSGKKADNKPRPLSDWLADQQSSGRRT